MSIWQSSTDDLIEKMKAEKLWRLAVVTDPGSGKVRATHPAFDELAEAIASDKRDYDRHEGLFFEIGWESDHLLSAAVHLTRRGQAAGGVRFWTYDTVEAFCRDGLRLSRGMGHKNALAGLWWGGGKGVVARRRGRDHRDPEVRGAVYRDYGRFMSGLAGCYVTAEDAGTTPPDMAVVFSKTRHTTCIPREFGGSGNPSVLTASGVVVGMEAALAWLGQGDLRGKTVATQGLGNVAYYMLPELIERGVARIVGVDIDESVVERAAREFGSVVEARRVAPGDLSIFGEACDVFSPNAVGGTLNPETISLLRCKVVCGAANNQLEDPKGDDVRLHERGILYVPDFLTNRMGIVNCANEQYGHLDADPAIYSHLEREAPHGIYQRAREVFERAQATGRPTGAEAVALADELAQEPHPIWGHRGQAIISNLIASGWAKGAPIEG